MIQGYLHGQLQFDEEVSKSHREALTIDGDRWNVTESWRAIERSSREEQALKGDEMAFNCYKEALKKEVQGKGEALKGDGRAFNCKEDALT